METTKRNTNLEITAINALNSLIAYRTELDNEFFSTLTRVDDDIRASYLERYYAVTRLVDEINHHFNPCEKQCATLL